MLVIGLIVALPREIPRGAVRIPGGSPPESFPCPFYRLTLAGCRLIVAQTGMGALRAAAGARFLVQQCAPQLLVSFGFAGSLLPELPWGTLVIGERVLSHGPEMCPYEADREAVEQMLRAARAERIPVWRGGIVTTPQVVLTASMKTALAGEVRAGAVDMETAGVAQVAREMRLPWVAVRAIVDAAGDQVPPECVGALGADGRVAAGRLLRDLCRSPRLIHTCLRLGRRTSVGRRRLFRLLQRWSTDLSRVLAPVPGGALGGAIHRRP